MTCKMIQALDGKRHSNSPVCFKRDQCVYTPCYCEENVWKLCDYVRISNPSELNKCYAVFISNKDEQIPLWHQRASSRADRLVVWDYHVILIYRQQEESLVYDLDSELPFPCHLDKYLSSAIRDDRTLQPSFRRLFRVILGEEYLKVFASDRSHMLTEDGRWKATPPPYPCIFTENCQNNLRDFISMDKTVGIGTVLTSAQLLEKFSS